MIKNTTAIPFS